MTTAPSGAHDPRQPEARSESHRFWLKLRKDRETGEPGIGLDGVRLSDMKYIFRAPLGECRLAGVKVDAKRTREFQMAEEGAKPFSKPKLVGPVNREQLKGDTEGLSALPILTFDEMEALYDFAEEKNICLRDAFLRTCTKDKYNREQLRRIAAAPAVFVKPDATIDDTPRPTAELDANIDRLLGLNQG